MSEKKKINLWVPVVVMGVIAILFSVFAFQSQVDLQAAQKEMGQMKNDLTECTEKNAQLLAKEQSLLETLVKEQAATRQAAEDCKQSNKRK